jgi:Nuclease-related domain
VALVAVAALAVAFLFFRDNRPALIVVGLVALAAIGLATKLIDPIAERWERGARGERKVGAALDGLGPEWHTLHDINLGCGNIDHVLVGPAGTFTVETKSHSGRISVDRIDDRMLRQAYAESKVLEKISGLGVEPLLVFSQAWLIGSLPAHRRGVTILPARMLPNFIGRRRPKLTGAEAADIAKRLRLALEVTPPETDRSRSSHSSHTPPRPKAARALTPCGRCERPDAGLFKTTGRPRRAQDEASAVSCLLHP